MCSQVVSFYLLSLLLLLLYNILFNCSCDILYNMYQGCVSVPNPCLCCRLLTMNALLLQYFNCDIKHVRCIYVFFLLHVKALVVVVR
jgi:hypothetical protein